MSSNTRTLFARIPRSLSAAAQRAAQPVHRIDAAFIRNFNEYQLDPTVKQVLQNSEGSINFSVNHTGQTSVSIIGKDHSVIGNENDIQKVATLGGQINEQRKLAAKETASSLYKRTLIVLDNEARKLSLDSENYKSPIIAQSFIDSYRPIMAQHDILEHNMKIIASHSPESDSGKLVRQHLLMTGDKLTQLFAEFLVSRFLTNSTEIKFGKGLFESKVPSWTFNRLVGAKLQTFPITYDISVMYFPRDQSKGFQLTYKEIMEPEFAESQGDVMQNNQGLLTWFRSESIIKYFCNVTNEGWNDEKITGPLQNVPILLLPPKWDLPKHLEEIARNNGRMQEWSVSNLLNPRANLEFLGTLFKRSFALGYQRVLTRKGLIEAIFPGFKYDSSKTDHVLVQLSIWAHNVPKEVLDACKLHQLYLPVPPEEQTINEFDSSLKLLFNPILGFDARDTGPEYQLLKYYISELLKGKKFVPLKLALVHTVSMTGIVNQVNSMVLNQEREKWIENHLDANLNRMAKKRRSEMSIFSQLSENGKNLLRMLKSEGKYAVMDNLDYWLRTFSTEKIQGSVAQILLARYDYYFRRDVDFKVEIAGESALDHEIVQRQLDEVSNSQLDDNF